MKMDALTCEASASRRRKDESGDQIIQHVIALAHGLNMKVVAEGVEKKEQAAFLQNMNCDQIQGYYYSSPKSYEVFDKMI